jgi:hypothetical protein
MPTQCLAGDGIVVAFPTCIGYSMVSHNVLAHRHFMGWAWSWIPELYTNGQPGIVGEMWVGYLF